jgi:hypothetical protein
MIDLSKEIRIEYTSNTTGAVTGAKTVKSELGGVDQQAKKTDEGFKAFDKTSEKLGNQMLKLGLAAAGAFIVFKGKNIFSDAISGALDSAKSQNLLEKAMQRTGGQYTFSTKQLREYADQLQIQKNVESEQVESVQRMYATMGVQEKYFKTLTGLTVDISKGLEKATGAQMDFMEVAKNLSESIIDPTKALEKFVQMGIVFTEEEKKSMRAMIEAGKEFELQEKLISILEKKYSGFADVTDSVGSNITGLKIAYDELMESMGSGFLEGFQGGAIGDLKDQLNSEQMRSQFEAFGKTVGDVSRKVVDFFVTTINWIDRSKDTLITLGEIILATFAVSKLYQFTQWVGDIRQKLANFQINLKVPSQEAAYNNIMSGASVAAQKSAGFFSTAMSSSFMNITALAGTTAISLALIFKQAMQMVIDNIDAEIERIQGEVNYQKKVSDTLRRIQEEGTKGESFFIKQTLDTIGKMADQFPGNRAVVYEGLMQKFYDANQRRIGKIIENIDTQKRAEKEIEIIRETASKAEEKRIDAMVKQGKTATEIMTAIKKGRKDEIQATKEATKAIDAQRDAYEKLKSELGFTSITEINTKNPEMGQLSSIWKNYNKEILSSQERSKIFFDKVSEYMKKLRLSGQDIPDWMREYGKEISNIIPEIGDFGIKTDSVAGSLENLDDINQKVLENMDRMAPSFQKAAVGNADLQKEIETLTVDMVKMIPVFEQVLQGLTEMGILDSETAGFFKTMIGGFTSLYDAQKKLMKLDDLTEKLTASGGKVSTKTYMAGFGLALSAAVSFASTLYPILQKIFGIDWDAEATSRMRGLTGVTQEMVKTLSKLSEELGSTELAYRKLFDQLLKMAEITNLEGLTPWSQSLEDMIDGLMASITDVQDRMKDIVGDKSPDDVIKFQIGFIQEADLEKNIKAVLDKFIELGEVGSEQFVKLIRKAKELEAVGIRIQAIYDFQIEQLGKTSNALSKYLDNVFDKSKADEFLQGMKSDFAKTQDELAQDIRDLQSKLGGGDLTAQEREKYLRELQRLTNQYNQNFFDFDARLSAKEKEYADSSIELRENWADIQGMVIGAMNGYLEAGVSIVDIYTLYMTDALDKVAKIAKDNGFDIDAALSKILNLGDFVKKNKAFVDNIKNVRDALEGMGSSGLFAFNQNLFDVYQSQIEKQFADVLKKGGSIDEAYMLLMPSLQLLNRYAESYGFTLDANIQKIIDEGKAQGKYVDAAKTTQETLADGLQITNDLLITFIEGMGIAVPEAIKKANRELDNFNGSIPGNEGAGPGGNGPNIKASDDVQYRVDSAIGNSTKISNAFVTAENISKISIDNISFKVITMGDNFVSAAEKIYGASQKIVTGINDIGYALDRNGKLSILSPSASPAMQSAPNFSPQMAYSPNSLPRENIQVIVQVSQDSTVPIGKQIASDITNDKYGLRTLIRSI